MKRQRPKTPTNLSSSSNGVPKIPPSTPNTITTQTPTTKHPISIISSFKKTKRTLFSKPLKEETLIWEPLNLSKSELYLPLTFPTGQTFRWKQTGPSQYTGVVKSHLLSLKQLENDVSYAFHQTTDECGARLAIADYLNVGISLNEMWGVFGERDSRFADLAMYLGGARVLRQDPLECLMQFLCTSNNNIGRITKMVDFISSLGEYLGSVEGFEFHEFPSLDRLSLVSEEELRVAGFGYRAKYIVGTVKALQSKPGGGAEWLTSLRELDLQEAVEALCTFPGVGPKVAACVALFSLDQHNAVPVDTHVWQLATQYLIPELAGARLTPKLCNRVAEAFVTKYGKYAGWAQTLLFIAELPSQKALLPPHLGTVKGIKSLRQKDGESGNLVQIQVTNNFLLL
ncbi:hypothetical protein GIB67_031975 [Kingdonia uniflora]|uniref:DNA-(apurinic or apyrimidinic site) lyase n=1 Tax=Kingdonia uniflora TaxID=39325 RepID=A0A7J7NTN7_9MAGN|nr:hypothetical protein GIB67_031975 [Kingdonia uniflora]